MNMLMRDVSSFFKSLVFFSANHSAANQYSALSTIRYVSKTVWTKDFVEILKAVCTFSHLRKPFYYSNPYRFSRDGQSVSLYSLQWY